MSTATSVSLPAEIEILVQELAAGLERILGENLYGLYLYGAAVFPDGSPLVDIDFHVILREPPGGNIISALGGLYDSLARDYPPLGTGLDGYYILLKDARRPAPPRHQLAANVFDKSWALHRAHLRAGRCIVLCGPDPQDLFPATSWSELKDALQGELDYVEAHLDAYPAYCVLNLCRLIYSFATHDVVISKHASAEWAIEVLPAWRRLIEAAWRSYGQLDTSEDHKLLKSRVNDFFAFANERIQENKNQDRFDHSAPERGS
jgi:hypothetical protein